MGSEMCIRDRHFFDCLDERVQSSELLYTSRVILDTEAMTRTEITRGSIVI